MTRVGVASASGRPRLVLEDGALSPRVLAATDTGARIALVATRALLLGGDHVVVDIDVGPGAWLRIDENAGTVAYDAGGVTSSWIVHARVSAGGALSWFGQPFVVADRAAVSRELIVDLAPGGTAVVRDTLVLGRSGERGGALRTRTRVRHDDTALHAEDLDLVNEADRGAPGLVGTFRVLDTLAAYGFRPPPDDPPHPTTHGRPCVSISTDPGRCCGGWPPTPRIRPSRHRWPRGPSTRSTSQAHGSTPVPPGQWPGESFRRAR